MRAVYSFRVSFPFWEILMAPDFCRHAVVEKKKKLTGVVPEGRGTRGLPMG